MDLLTNIDARLQELAHPWVLFMKWRDLFFASWRVSVEALRSVVPGELEIDTFDGSAWITLVPMRITDMHWRGIAPIPGMEGLRELNLRTYTTRNGKPGVYFLSIECPAICSDWIARNIFGAPYYEAQIALCNDGVSWSFASERTQEGMHAAAFFGTFRPAGEASRPAPGSLEHFLVERYCLYFVKDGAIWRGDIDHDEWKLQNADMQIAVNTVPSALGLALAAKPDHTAYCVSTDTRVWPPVKEERASGGTTGTAPTASFHLVTVWRIASPRKPVWDAIYHFEDWPKWWKGVLHTDVVNQGDANRIGFQTRQVWKSKLPYELRFETRVTRMEPMSLIEVRSEGELDGTGLMRFSGDGDQTIFQVDWEVRTTKEWMTKLTPLLRPAYEWNHNTIMDWGAECLSKKLGIPSIETSTQGVL